MESDSSLWGSMSIIRAIVMYAARNEAEVRLICQRSGLTPEQLHDTTEKLSLEGNCAVMEAAVAVSGDTYLGLHMGERLSPSVLGTTGYLIQSSENMLTALQYVDQFTPAFTKIFQYRLEQRGSESYFFCEPLPVWNDRSPETARQSVDFSFAGTLYSARLLTGRTIQPKKVLYRYGRVGDTAEHERILMNRPSYEQGCNCLVFNTSDLQFPLLGYNKALACTFQQALQDELRQAARGVLFAESVRRALLEDAPLTMPTLETVASRLHMTPRTLQRKLSREQTTFRAVADSVKQTLALHLLKNDVFTIDDIAFRLGYTSSSAFRKAFRQWTGQTPGAYRSTDSAGLPRSV